MYLKKYSFLFFIINFLSFPIMATDDDLRQVDKVKNIINNHLNHTDENNVSANRGFVSYMISAPIRAIRNQFTPYHGDNANTFGLCIKTGANMLLNGVEKVFGVDEDLHSDIRDYWSNQKFNRSRSSFNLNNMLIITAWAISISDVNDVYKQIYIYGSFINK